MNKQQLKEKLWSMADGGEWALFHVWSPKQKFEVHRVNKFNRDYFSTAEKAQQALDSFTFDELIAIFNTKRLDA